jgi:hypothetical protein
MMHLPRVPDGIEWAHPRQVFDNGAECLEPVLGPVKEFASSLREAGTHLLSSMGLEMPDESRPETTAAPSTEGGPDAA